MVSNTDWRVADPRLRTFLFIFGILAEQVPPEMSKTSVLLVKIPPPRIRIGLLGGGKGGDVVVSNISKKIRPCCGFEPR